MANKYLNFDGLSHLIDKLKASIEKKVDKVEGKTLSTNDYTDIEKTKLAGIEEGANKYTLPSAGTSLGGVKSGGDVTISGGVITVNDDSHNHVISNVDGLQTALDGKSDDGHGHEIADVSGLQSALNGKEASGAAESALNTAKEYADTKSEAALNTSKSYTDGEIDTVTELLEEEIGAVNSDLTSHTSNKSNPHGVTAEQVGADPKGTAATAVSSHNTNTAAHSDIRDLITGLTTRLNTLADSDDATLDQMSEIVAYIKSNKELIDSITTSKVNVSDIIDNLTTNVSNKPLSAAQGVVLKGLIDSINTNLEDLGAGDMLKSVYDTDGDGIVDNAEKLGGQLPSYYAAASAIPTKTSQLTNDSGFKTTDTTYDKATSSTLGLVKIGYTESGKNYPVELNSSGQMFVNVPWTDNNTVYTHPTYTAKSNGLYKVTVDSTGHVSETAAVTKADITALGIPAQDTTYTLSSFGITATAAELNYVDGVTSNIQTQINALITRIAELESKVATLEASVGFSTNESDM